MQTANYSDSVFDYQLDRHCSKTRCVQVLRILAFDYQLDRHCSKTTECHIFSQRQFDYQLDRHCSKTKLTQKSVWTSLITS